MKKALLLFIILFAFTIKARGTDVTISASTQLGFQPTGVGTDTTLTNVTVTNSSTTVTCSACLRTAWIGLSGFKIKINSVTYSVATVVDSSTLTLTTSYAGITSSTATVVWYKYIEIKIYADRSFRPLGTTTEVQPGVPGSSAFYKRYAASIINDGATNTLYIPDMIVYATTDAPDNNQARYVFGLYRPDGSLIQYYTCAPSVAQLRVPPTTPTTLPDLCIYNNTPAIVTNNDAYTKAEIDARFPSCGSGTIVYHQSTGLVTTCLSAGTGVTINTSNNTINAGMCGSGAANQVTIWSGANSCTGYEQLKYTNATNLFQIANGTPTTIFEFAPTSGYTSSAPFGASAGNTTETRWLELAANGTNYFAVKAADNITTNRVLVWPNNSPSANQVLTVTGFSGGVITTTWGTTDCIVNSSNKQVFYNNSGACYGAAGFEYNNTPSGTAPSYVKITPQTDGTSALNLLYFDLTPTDPIFRIRDSANVNDVFRIDENGIPSTPFRPDTGGLRGAVFGVGAVVTTNSTAFGDLTSANADGSSVFGDQAQANFNYSIAIGYQATAFVANQLAVGSGNGPINDVLIRADAAMRMHTNEPSGDNQIGYDFIASSGKMIGAQTVRTFVAAGRRGAFRVQTGRPSGDGISTATYIDRLSFNGIRSIPSANNTAQALFEVDLPTLEACGGTVSYVVYAGDGTDIQIHRAAYTFSAVNKGGSYTTDLDLVQSSNAVSAGTLTGAATITTGTNKIIFNVTPNTSLTPTSGNFWIQFSIHQDSERALTITAP